MGTSSSVKVSHEVNNAMLSICKEIIGFVFYKCAAAGNLAGVVWGGVVDLQYGDPGVARG